MCQETAGNIAYNRELDQVLASLRTPTVSINERYVGKPHTYTLVTFTDLTGEGDEIVRAAMARAAAWAAEEDKK
jgi:hypothetical protein